MPNLPDWLCGNCGHAWQQKPDPSTCPSCHATLGVEQTLDYAPGEMMIHGDECSCLECLRWFSTMEQGHVSGKCGRCNQLIDNHSLDEKGRMRACPARAA